MSDNGDTIERADRVDPLPSLHALHRRGEMDTARAVLLRVQWARRDHPETILTTELAHLDDRLVVVKAAVTLPTGTSATGHAAEQPGTDDDRGAAVERAETRAIGRALDLLGYTLVDAESASSVPDQQQDTAGESPAEPTPLDTSPSGRSETTGGRWSTPSREPRPVDGGPRPPVVDALRRIRRPEPPDVPDQAPPETAEPPSAPDRQGGRRPPITLRPRSQGSQGAQNSPTGGSPASATDDADEPPLEDYSWNAFWRWARQRGYSSHEDLAQAIGRPTQGLTPAQIRTALREAGVED